MFLDIKEGVLSVIFTIVDYHRVVNFVDYHLRYRRVQFSSGNVVRYISVVKENNFQGLLNVNVSLFIHCSSYLLLTRRLYCHTEKV